MGQKLYSDQEGLIAAALLTVLWCPIYYSQEARAYSLLLLLSLLTVYFWVDLVRGLDKGQKVSRRLIFAYLTAAIIAAYLHYYGVYFILLQGVLATLLFLRKGRALLYIFAIYLCLLLAYIPWIPTMIAQVLNGGGSWIPVPEYTAFLTFMRFLFNNSSELLNIVLILYGVLFVTLLYNRFKKDRAYQAASLISSPTILLILWLIVPFAVVFFISITIKPILTNRNLIILLPAAYLLLARAITQLPIRQMGQNIVMTLLLGIFLNHLVFGMNYYSEPRKQQFREAVAHVVSETPQYEDSVVIGFVWKPDYLNYYFEKQGSEQRVSVIGGETEDFATVANFIETENKSYIWYIAAHRRPSPEFVEMLEQNFRLIQRTPFVGAQVWLFENQSSGEETIEAMR